MEKCPYSQCVTVSRADRLPVRGQLKAPRGVRPTITSITILTLQLLPLTLANHSQLLITPLKPHYTQQSSWPVWCAQPPQQLNCTTFSYNLYHYH